MAVTKGDRIRINEVISYINTNARNKIQSKLQWWRENRPSSLSSNFVYSLNSSSSGKTNIKSAAQEGKFSKKNPLDWDTFFTKIQALYVSWVSIRKIHYLRKKYTNENGNPKKIQTYVDTTGYGSVSEVDVASVDALTEVDNTGKIIKAQQIIDLTNSLYNTWSKLPTLQWEYIDPCHTNCHDDCHGSGGFR